MATWTKANALVACLADSPDCRGRIKRAGRTWFVTVYHKRFCAILRPLFRHVDEASDEELGVAFTKLLLIHCENVAYAPAYIESLLENRRREIEEIFVSTLHQARPYSNVPHVNIFAS
jgi:hypothetical protein